MMRFLEVIEGDCLLLWMSDRRPEDASARASSNEPLFVTRGMIDALAPMSAGLVEAVSSPDARDEGLGTRGFLPGEEGAARALPGPRFHVEVADALAGAILGPGPIKRRRTPRTERGLRLGGSGF